MKTYKFIYHYRDNVEENEIEANGLLDAIQIYSKNLNIEDIIKIEWIEFD
jgi:hypothetical protein